MRLSRRATLTAAALGIIGAVAGGVAIGRHSQVDAPRRVDAARLMNELMTGKVPIGGPFTLHDTSGRRVSLTDFRGKVVVLYFGYTFCPDVCPTDLQAIAAALDRLGADANKAQPLFVTLDPQRDTPEQLEKYVKGFSPRVIALTGSESEVRAVATAYKVFFEKVAQPGSKHYVVDHTAFTFVVDAEGQYAGFFPPGTEPERMASVVSEVLKGR